MMPAYIQINASTNRNRHEVIADVRDTISQHKGWILDFHAFSNISVNLQVELKRNTLLALADALEDIGLRLTSQSLKRMQTFASEHANHTSAEQYPGTIQMTFIHNEPDLKREIPKVPG